MGSYVRRYRLTEKNQRGIIIIHLQDGRISMEPPRQKGGLRGKSFLWDPHYAHTIWQIQHGNPHGGGVFIGSCQAS